MNQGFSFGQITPVQSIFYNDPSNRGVGWQMLKDYLNRSGNRAFDNFLDSRASTEYNRALATSANNPNYLWTQHLEGLPQDLLHQWQNTPAAARGASGSLYGAQQVYLG